MNGLGSPVSFWSSSGRCCVCLVSSRFPWPPERGPHPSLVGMRPPQPSPGLSFQHSCQPFLWPALGSISLAPRLYFGSECGVLRCVEIFDSDVIRSSSFSPCWRFKKFFPNRRTMWIVFYSFLYEVFICSESLSICKS